MSVQDKASFGYIGDFCCDFFLMKDAGETIYGLDLYALMKTSWNNVIYNNNNVFFTASNMRKSYLNAAKSPV